MSSMVLSWPGIVALVAALISAFALEVWPESHWPGFALRQADVLQS